MAGMPEGAVVRHAIFKTVQALESMPGATFVEWISFQSPSSKLLGRPLSNDTTSVTSSHISRDNAHQQVKFLYFP